MSSICRFSSIDLTKLHIFGGQDSALHVRYDGERFLFETPVLCCYDPIKPVNTRHSTHELIVPLTGVDDPQTLSVTKFFNDLDDKIIAESKEHVRSRVTPNGDAQLSYKSLISSVDNDCGQYENGVLRMKFVRTDEMSTLFFDQDGHLITPSQYEKAIPNEGCYVKMILELPFVWMKGNVFGACLKLHQIKMVRNHPLDMVSFHFSCDHDVASDDDI